LGQEGLFTVFVASFLANSKVPTITKTPNSNKEWKNPVSLSNIKKWGLDKPLRFCLVFC